MVSLRIEICNERLLPRFGVDRTLIMLGRRLQQSGHHVSFVCLRCEPSMLSSITSDLTTLALPEGLDMVGTEAAVMAAMEERWRQNAPDIVIVGGWPFCEAAARAPGFGIKSIFNDHGAVAQDGLRDPHLTIQLELRRIRQLALPFADWAVPISSFIRRSQTEHDRGSDVQMRTILHGADHMELGIVGSGPRQLQDQRTLDRLTRLVENDARLLLALGRFEGQGYKNSPAAYDVLRQVRQQVPEARLLVLDAGADCGVPQDLSPVVERLGAPDDLTLQEIMKLSSAGISTSRWEGFNLPVVEMQWLSRPAVAFNLGGHPEVIADPWLLCEDEAEMAGKLVQLLRGETPVDLAPRFAAFRERFTWERALDRWEAAIAEIAAGRQDSVPVQNGDPRQRRIVLVDVTNASLDSANPGVIRVVRRLCCELQHRPEFDLVFAGWNQETADYEFLNATRRMFLESYSGPTDGLGLMREGGRNLTPAEFVHAINIGRLQPPVLFTPEVLLDGGASARADWAQRNGFKFAAILHDIIAISHPELCDPKITAVFPEYLDALLRCDAVWFVSGTTQDAFSWYAGLRQRSLPAVRGPVWLPGQFGKQLRRTDPPANDAPEVRILCVSTLEPRKNHSRLLEAFASLRERRPELPVRLVMIGNRYAGAPEIAEQVQAAARRDQCVEWHGAVSDERLAEEFDRATFTVYPSVVEGFGLPILESLWMGRPCVTHNDGVMRELAEQGGCMVADMTNPVAMMQAVETLATDRELLARLRREACSRKIKTWRDYTDEMADRLARIEEKVDEYEPVS